jgi:hypothetical protein
LKFIFYKKKRKIIFRDDIVSEDDDDEDELDSRNCTIDDEQNESIIIHPRVVLPQSSTKKRLLNHPDEENDLQKKRLRYEDPSQRITFECYTSMSSSENLTRPFIVSTDIKMIDNSYNEQQNCLTIDTDDTLSSSTINSTKTTTSSSSSIEQTLPTTKLSTVAHRFVSKKIFKPETCFVVKEKRFFSDNHRKSFHIMFSVSNESILVLYHIVVPIVHNHLMLIVKKMQVQIVKHCQLMQCYHLIHLKHQQCQH